MNSPSYPTTPNSSAPSTPRGEQEQPPPQQQQEQQQEEDAPAADLGRIHAVLAGLVAVWSVPGGREAEFLRLVVPVGSRPVRLPSPFSSGGFVRFGLAPGLSLSARPSSAVARPLAEGELTNLLGRAVMRAAAREQFLGLALRAVGGLAAISSVSPAGASAAAAFFSALRPAEEEEEEEEEPRRRGRGGGRGGGARGRGRERERFLRPRKDQRDERGGRGGRGGGGGGSYGGVAV
jgi:hypothetical protein